MSSAVAADQPAPAAASRSARRLGLSVAVAVAWVVIDQLTKWWALEHLTDRTIDVVWTLRFNLAYNRGMAFGQGQGWGPVIGVVALVVVVTLLVSLRRSGSRLAAVGVGMVVGGALGNLIDRAFRAGDDGFLHGAVVDFIDFQWWPVFNIADVGITVGAAILLFSAWRSPDSPR